MDEDEKDELLKALCYSLGEYKELKPDQKDKVQTKLADDIDRRHPKSNAIPLSQQKTLLIAAVQAYLPQSVQFLVALGADPMIEAKKSAKATAGEDGMAPLLDGFGFLDYKKNDMDAYYGKEKAAKLYAQIKGHLDDGKRRRDEAEAEEE